MKIEETGKDLQIKNNPNRILVYRNKWYEQTERWENNHITKRFSNRDGTSHLDKILEAADDDDDFSVIFK
jgi:hypothetical protein